MMKSTQLQSLIYNALQSDIQFCRSVRADLIVVCDRYTACKHNPVLC